MKTGQVKLGLGLIGIGMEWGFKPSAIPEEGDVLRFLSDACSLNVDFFDTAPSYGKSEVRLGKFLCQLDKEKRKRLTVATKFGEHWDEKTNTSYVDHSLDALCKSIDQSLERLGTIDVLQVHKTRPDVLKSKDISDAILYARQKGVKAFGASVTDLESGRITCESEMFSFIQFPFNAKNIPFGMLFELAKKNNKRVLINRPFAMGEVLYANTIEDSDKKELQIEAFRVILNNEFNGYVLSGTKSIDHLRENLDSFQKAVYGLSSSDACKA